MKRTVLGLSFQRVGVLLLNRSIDGRPLEYTYQLGNAVTRNRHGAGLFCDFTLAEATALAGVYTLTVGDEIKYVGECESLESRFGPQGYGHVSPRNCHIDGQATNCKINAAVLRVSEDQDRVEVWFLVAESGRKSIESRLIRGLAPPWNGRTASAPGDRLSLQSLRQSQAPGRPGTRFAVVLQEILAAGEGLAQRTIRVRAGDLHLLAGGYPGPSHRMPECCRAMREAMTDGDVVVESPPKGAGASLVIEYRLPRGK